MADDPLGLVYNKRDNSGAAVVFPESKETAVDYYLRQQDAQLKRDAIARARADKLLDKNEGKTSTMMSKFWEYDKPYASELRAKLLKDKAEIMKNDPLLKNPQSLQKIQEGEDAIRDASHLSTIQEKLLLEGIKDITKNGDTLYDNRDEALAAWYKWAQTPTRERTFSPMDSATMRANPVDVFKYVNTFRVPTRIDSKPVDIGGGVIKQVDTKVFDADKSEAKAHLLLGGNPDPELNLSPEDMVKYNKFGKRLLAMGNDYVETNYPNMAEEDKPAHAVEWATQHFVEIQRTNWDAYNKEQLKNKPTGDATGVKKVGSSLLVGNTNWGYRTDQQGKEIFTITPVSKTGKPGQNAPTDWLDPTSSDPKNMTRGSLQGVINDNGNWTVTVSVPVMGHTQSGANVIKGYREEDIAYNEFNAGKIKGMHGLLPIEVKAKLGLSSSVLPSAAPDKVIIDKKQKESEIKQAREKTAQDKAINKYELTKTKKPKKKLF